MTYGLNLYSNAGLLAFSSTYKSYRLLQKLTLTTQTPFGIGSYRFEFTVTSPNGSPICFVKPSGTFNGHDTAISIIQTNIIGNVYYFAAMTQNTVRTVSSGPVYVYVFVPGASPSTAYGINVFNGLGEITFNTSDRLLKISGYYITIQTFDEVTPSPTPSSLSYGTIPAQYAISAPNIGIRYQTATSFFLIILLGSFVDSSNLLQYGPMGLVGQAPGTNNAQSVIGSIYVPVIDTSLYD